MKMYKLQGKKAVITGGSRGIGKAVAKTFLEHGSEVLLFANNERELEATGTELSLLGKVSVLCGDVSREDAVARVAKSVRDRWGRVDVLVNAAGIYGPIGSVTDVDPDEWREAVAVNLFGTFLMISAIAPVMKKNGSGVIVNFVGGGEGAYPNFTSYVSAKGGIARLTETVAAELADYNISVNAIAPGAVNTAFLEELLAAGPEKAGKANYKRALKQKKTGGVPPERAASLVLFLASDAARGLSGKVLSAVWDLYTKFPDHLEDIMSTDVYTMRRIRPSDRGFSWGGDD